MSSLGNRREVAPLKARRRCVFPLPTSFVSRLLLTRRPATGDLDGCVALAAHFRDRN